MPKAANNRKVAIIDIGTNAVRLLAVEFAGQRKYKSIRELRLPVRLGTDMFAASQITAPALRRAAAACRRMVRLSRRLGLRRIIAVVTAAGREARNSKALLEKIRRSAGVSPVILSAEKEARLVYAGVTGGLRPGRKKILVIEIGGGSTELAAGTGQVCRTATALSMGAVKMKHLFPASGGHKPLPEKEYRRMVAGLSKRIKPNLRKFTGKHYDLVLGSAGTIRALAEIIPRLELGRAKQPEAISFRQVGNAARLLGALSLAQRKRLLKTQPDRADIMLGGTAILEALMGLLKIKSIRVSRRGLREGLVLEADPAFAAGNGSR